MGTLSSGKRKALNFYGKMNDFQEDRPQLVNGYIIYEAV
jgi:hypothetical protein